MNIKQCTEITSNLTQLRQGDIIFFKSKPEAEQYGIVVTGDCDIARKKCHGIISYCSITTVKHYVYTEILNDICIANEINVLKNSVIQGVCKKLNAEKSTTFLSTLLKLDEPDFKNLSNRRGINKENKCIKKFL